MSAFTASRASNATVAVADVVIGLRLVTLLLVRGEATKRRRIAAVDGGARPLIRIPLPIPSPAGVSVPTRAGADRKEVLVAEERHTRPGERGESTGAIVEGAFMGRGRAAEAALALAVLRLLALMPPEATRELGCSTVDGSGAQVPPVANSDGVGEDADADGVAVDEEDDAARCRAAWNAVMGGCWWQL